MLSPLINFLLLFWLDPLARNDKEAPGGNQGSLRDRRTRQKEMPSASMFRNLTFWS